MQPWFDDNALSGYAAVHIFVQILQTGSGKDSCQMKYSD